MKMYKSILSLSVSTAILAMGGVAQSAEKNENFVAKENFQFIQSNAAFERHVRNKSQISSKISHAVSTNVSGLKKPNFSSKSTKPLSERYADYYLQQRQPQLSSTANINKLATQRVELKYVQQTNNGPIIAKYQQIIGEHEVLGREYNILMDNQHNFIADSGYFSNQGLSKNIGNKSSNKNNAFDLTAERALQFAVKDLLGNDTFVIAQPTKQSGRYQHFEIVQASAEIELNKDIRTKKVWYDAGESILAAYYVEIFGQDFSKQQVAYSYAIDAQSGKVLFRKNLVEFDSFDYRVFTPNAASADKSIFEGPQGHEYPIIGTDPNVVNANFNRIYQAASHQLVTVESAPFSNNDPWLAASATTTNGNNVNAYLDIGGSDGFDVGDVTAETTSANTFDYAYDKENPTTTESRKSAVVNLFYMNNWLHDWFYDSGFDEASNNAQNNNYGRGGVGGDAIDAEGQDSSGRNNANMSTPSDGASPRMQMYLYDGAAVQGVDHDLMLTGAGSLTNPAIALASYGPQTYNVTADVVAYIDGVASPSTTDGCEAATNGAALNGKIALIDRGECNFTVKVKNAQDVGAVGVLIANNRDGNVVSGLGGDDATVTIPSVMVSQNDGATIRTELSSGTVGATLTRSAVPDLDGTFDNAIIAHEWGHYITNRIIGNASGLTNNQGRSMGEGWGDFFALLTFAGENDDLVAGNEQYQGLYPMYGWADDNAYFGIRRVPYTTNFTLNGLTFKHIEENVALPNTHPVRFGADGSSNTEVHAAGEVWANVLWEVYVGLLNDPRHSFIQAQDKMKDYLVGALKLTPVAPTFLEARDAMLMMGLATDATDYQTMLKAFAKRGMGVGAIGPDRDSTTHSGVIESFIETQARFDFANSSINNSFDNGSPGFCTDDSILDVGETSQIRVTIKNTGTSVLTNVPVKLTSAANVSFANNGDALIASLAQNQTIDLLFEITLNGAATAEDITVNVTFPDDGGAVIEPATESLIYKVNYDIGPDASRSIEDFTVSELALHDWSIEVNAANTVAGQGAENTFSIIPTVSGRPDLGAALKTVDNSYMSDVSFVSPSLDIGTSNFSISFEHFYDFEVDDWDGGVLELSVNGGAWQDVTAVGGTFAVGYNGVIVTNPDSPISARNAYVSTAADYIQETVDFGTTHANQTVRFRFRQGTDAAAGAPGWIIDNVNFTGVTNAFLSGTVANAINCAGNSAPDAQVANANITVTEGDSVSLDASSSSDPDGDSLTFIWEQTSGPTVTLANENTATASFSAPDVDSQTALAFEVTVSDGDLESTATVDVTVNDTASNTAPTAQVVNANITVAEGGNVSLDASSSSDPEGDSLSYSWTQTSGQTVSLSNASSATASFTAPNVNSATALAFEVTVSDGSLDSTATVNVTVNDTPPTGGGGSGGGGGGSFGLLSLLGLGFIAGLRRRKLKK